MEPGHTSVLSNSRARRRVATRDPILEPALPLVLYTTASHPGETMQRDEQEDAPAARRKVSRQALVKWLLLSEALILLFALGGPGSRRPGRDGNWLGRWLFEEPGWAQSVLAYFLLYNLAVALLLLAAHVAARRRAARSGKHASRAGQ